ncbi:MAG: hypothetical protein AAGF12_25005 [Myxococcota bacterium]
MRILGIICLIASWGAPIGVALGQAESALSETDAQARAHFVQGRAHFDDGLFSEAAVEFRRAYDLSGRIDLLMNTALAHERALEYDQARATLQEFIRETPEGFDGRQEAIDREARIAGLQREAEARVRAQLEAEQETTTEPETEPETETEPVTREGGGLSTLQLAGIITGGAGLAIGVASLITGLVAAGIESDLEDQCDSNGRCPADLQSDIDNGSTLAGVSTALMFVSIAAVAGGVTLFLIGTGGDETPVAVRVGPASASIQGAF